MKGSRRLLENSSDENSGMLRTPWTRPPSRRCGPDRSSAGARFRRPRRKRRRVESVKKLIETSALALVGAQDLGVRVRFQFDPPSISCSPIKYKSSRWCST